MTGPEVPHKAELQKLEVLLRRRLSVIADHAWRDRDPEAHLAALRSVGEDLMALSAGLSGRIDPRLAHYLERNSFDKALAWLEGRTVEGAH